VLLVERERERADDIEVLFKEKKKEEEEEEKEEEKDPLVNSKKIFNNKNLQRMKKTAFTVEFTSLLLLI